MPNQSHSGWQGRPWSRCDRCGQDNRVDEMALQNGLLLCVKCYDDPSQFHRDAQIAAKLADGASEELANVTARKRGEDDSQFVDFDSFI